MDRFCPEGTFEGKCYSVESVDFDSEEKILDVILDIFKSELPPRMRAIKDCTDNPMIITEESIDILPPQKYERFNLILNPLGDVPAYLESREMRTVDYNFELILTASNTLARCVTWELLRFKNVVESLIVATEIYIDGYNSVFIEPRGFTYFIPEVDDGVYRRQGAYRFAVTVTQNRIR